MPGVSYIYKLCVSLLIFTASVPESVSAVLQSLAACSQMDVCKVPFIHMFSPLLTS